MKKVILAILASVFVLSVPVTALEWGGVARSFSEYISPDFKSTEIQQSSEVYLWGKIPFGKESPFSLTGEIVYKNVLDFAPAGFKMTNVLDVDILKIAGNIEFGQSSTIDLSLGRFHAVDTSRRLFNQLIDGAAVSLQLPWLGLSAFGGYTGFINCHSTTMMDQQGYSSIPTNDIYALNLPYLVAEGRIDFPYILNHTLSLEALAFFDTRNYGDSRFFGEISLSGPFWNFVYFKIDSILGINYQYEISNYTNLAYMIYPFDSMVIEFGAEYASGVVGPLKTFYPVTSQIACCSASYPALAGVLVPNLSITISKGPFYGSLVGKVLFSMPEITPRLSGAEVRYTTQYNIFSDFKVIGDAGYYYDLENAGDTQFTATLGVSVSF